MHNRRRSVIASPMTAHGARPTVVRNQEDLFKNVYLGFINGLQIPVDGIQYGRLTGTNGFEGITGATTTSTNEEGWISVNGNAKKVVPGRRDQFGKTWRFGKLGMNIGITSFSSQQSRKAN